VEEFRAHGRLPQYDVETMVKLVNEGFHKKAAKPGAAEMNSSFGGYRVMLTVSEGVPPEPEPEPQ